MNDKLSEDALGSCGDSLIQQGGVPVRHLVAPGAMGEYGPAASNETKAGRPENRRVEVKILVNKGIAGRPGPLFRTHAPAEVWATPAIRNLIRRQTSKRSNVHGAHRLAKHKRPGYRSNAHSLPFCCSLRLWLRNQVT